MGGGRGHSSSDAPPPPAACTTSTGPRPWTSACRPWRRAGPGCGSSPEPRPLGSPGFNLRKGQISSFPAENFRHFIKILFWQQASLSILVPMRCWCRGSDVSTSACSGLKLVRSLGPGPGVCPAGSSPGVQPELPGAGRAPATHPGLPLVCEECPASSGTVWELAARVGAGS